jgi:hypothetical protein
MTAEQEAAERRNIGAEFSLTITARAMTKAKV